ncbi:MULTISPECIES: HpcH/HpaI aldolase family protein [Cupriavidus]|uniref:HpcH/HpaI aldolase family protein n=1 Tax=Cupriavidus sp. DF5525 TaxID=3160989 RepID=UPI0003B09848|nr:2,4-dihydroxyhept-2-ene-1,7-dioic acid aldolase [Ralstonia pickettii DTP0602]
MRENRIRTMWAADQAVVNGWLSIPSAFAAETMAHQGWDSLTVDLQHGALDYADALALLTAISTTNTVPVVRVPWNEPGVLMKVLDAGAYGVICPMVNNRADAERLVAATRYPPLGARSFGPIRGLLYGGADYPERANDTVVVLAMIETLQGLDNLDEILSVDGLDGVYIGPSDLSLALGCRPTFDDVDPPVVQAIAHVIARTKAHGRVAGIHNGAPEAALRRIQQGFRFVTVSSDARLMAAGARQVISQMRAGLVPPPETASGY